MELYTTYQPRLKSLQGNFRPRPDLVIARSIHQGIGVMTERTRVVSYLLDDLFSALNVKDRK